MQRLKSPLILILAVLAAGTVLAWQGGLFSVLSSTTTLGKQPSGVFLVPSNQLLAPWGTQTLIQGRPVDMAFTADRRLLAILNTKGVLLADPATGAALGNIVSRTTSYAGVVFRPDGREIWASEVTRNGPDSLLVAELSTTGAPGQAAHVALAGHPVPVGIAMSADGATAYVAFSRNNSLAVIDVATRQVKREVPVGMAPHGVAFSKLNGRLFVTNRGGRRVRAGDTPAPTSGARVASDPVTGSTVSGTVSVIDLRTFDVTEVTVGLAPSGLALSPDERQLAVVNGHSDSVSIVGAEDLTVSEVKIPAMPEGTLGSQPIAAAFAPDGKTIYVACGGNNAIAVLQGSGRSWKLTGWMPTAWFPSAVGVGPEGALSVVSIKGLGNTADEKGGFRSTAYEGSLERIPATALNRLDAGTREVKASNQPRFTPAGGVENLTSLGIRHVFLIIKENRTYDQVFGDMPKGNNDPKLVMYGREITPNHHALAEQFVLLDNFYATSAISFDGHHWLMQAFVSDYVQRAFAASPRGYAWDMSDALTVAPTGFFWQGARRPVDVHIWGEFCLPARWDPATQSAVDINERGLLKWSDYWKLYQEGKWQQAVGCSAAGVPALRSIMSPRYPVNETALPDQIRAEEFLRDLGEREKTGEMANINVITLTADHTNGTRFGSPTPRAMVADNDLALGRMVEGISRSRFWPKSLILVVEDDAQNGIDHVDGHRTVALAIGPNVRRGALDSNNYNQVSMIRTIQEIFQIPARTRALKASRSMTSVLTPKADATPYKCLPANMKLDEMNPPPKTLNGRARWAAEQSAAMNWHDVDDIPSDVLNRILWWDAKGYDKPYPGLEILRAQKAAK
jgi:YVTN family beta-propeller protein